MLINSKVRVQGQVRDAKEKVSYIALICDTEMRGVEIMGELGGRARS